MSSTRPNGSKMTQSVARAGVRGKLMLECYGFFQKDVVIILANGVSLVILSVILYLKLFQR
jgi:lipid-A-disaccharide synthase-like uncharacterized protein